MESVGFTRGRSTPVIFRNDETETTLVVHGDDFTFLGYPEELESIRAHMETWWDIKLRGIIGNDPGDDKTITILNRVLHWDGGAITLKADSKHRSSILEAFDLTEESKGITVNPRRYPKKMRKKSWTLKKRGRSEVSRPGRTTWARTGQTSSTLRRKYVGEWPDRIVQP